MNKKALTAIFIIFCVVFLLFVIKAMLSKEAVKLDQTNRTFIVKGDVKIKKAKGEAQWQKMDTSTVLEKGDVIETAEGSMVDLVIGSNADKSVKVEEKSRIEVESINPTSLNLPNGRIMVALKKLEPKSSFTIKTPTAVCGSRGTAWLEEVSIDRTKVCVFESSIYARELDVSGRPKTTKHTVDEGTQRVLLKDKPISEARKIEEKDLEEWKDWSGNVAALMEGKVLVNDFNKKENLNNLGGVFGSWVVFYSDTNQYCRDEFSALETRDGKGYCLKLSYDVDSPFSAYNGFFTKLMDVDLSGYHYLVFYIKGDKAAGYTTRLNVELKNKGEIGKITVEGITDEWQEIVLPFEKFTGITTFQNMKEIVLVFSDLNATQKVGVIYIDEIYFARTEEETQ